MAYIVTSTYFGMLLCGGVWSSYAIVFCLCAANTPGMKGDHLQVESTISSDSTSIGDSTHKEPEALSNLQPSDFQPSIGDSASVSEGMMDSHYSQMKEDACIYGGFSGHYDRSQSMPPVKHHYQQKDVYFNTPPIHTSHPRIQRRYTYPPTPGYSVRSPSSPDLVGLSVLHQALYVYMLCQYSVSRCEYPV